MLKLTVIIWKIFQYLILNKECFDANTIFEDEELVALLDNK